MSLPVVAIVGRPNVEKSALFNRLVQKRVAIEERAQRYRDRIYGRVKWTNPVSNWLIQADLTRKTDFPEIYRRSGTMDEPPSFYFW